MCNALMNGNNTCMALLDYSPICCKRELVTCSEMLQVLRTNYHHNSSFLVTLSPLLFILSHLYTYTTLYHNLSFILHTFDPYLLHTPFLSFFLHNIMSFLFLLSNFHIEEIRPQTLGVSISIGAECTPGLREFCGAVGYDLQITGKLLAH